MGLFGPKSPEEERFKELTGGILVSDDYLEILKGNGLTVAEGETIREKVKNEINNGSLGINDILDRLDYLIKEKAKSKGYQPRGYDTSIIHPNLSTPIKHDKDLSDMTNREIEEMLPKFCPNCGGKIEGLYVFCDNCQAYVWDQTSDEYLKRMIDDTLRVAGVLDTEDYANFNVVNELKTKGFSIHSIFLSDYARLLSFLSECDRIISDDEVKFINEYLHLNFTKKQIKNLAGTIDENYVNKLPISIIIAHELDTEFENETCYFINMCNLYVILGMLFIACDGNVDPKEKSVLIDYCNKLDKNTKKLESGRYGSIDISRRQQGSIRIIDNAKKKTNNKKTDICSKCGFKNRPKVKFCTNCGNKMI